MVVDGARRSKDRHGGIWIEIVKTDSIAINL